MDAARPLPFRRHAQGVSISFRIVPAAPRSAFRDIPVLDDGSCVIRAAVAAPPEDGQANKALIALLSKTWKLPKAQFSLLSGAAHRHKTVLVTGDTDALWGLLCRWAESFEKQGRQR